MSGLVCQCFRRIASALNMRSTHANRLTNTGFYFFLCLHQERTGLMSSMESTNQHKAERHESLWYEDGNIVLQSEFVLFKVHRSVLSRQSDFFKNMFALPNGAESGESEGSEARPLLLPQVSSSGLANLLMMLYTVSGYDLPLSDDEFGEVLGTAHRFQCRDVLEIVPRRMDARLPAERKLELGLQYDLEHWQLRPFQELVLSFRPRVPETNRLSDTVWMKVFAARAQVSKARIDHITMQRGYEPCGHLVAALVSTVPFSPPAEYKKEYQACRYRLRPAFLYFDPHAVREHECCKPSRNPDDDWLHTVLPPADAENVIIAAVWKSS